MAACFGGTWVAGPWATDEIPPLTVAWARFTLAAVLLLAYVAVRRLPLAVTRDDWRVIAGMAVTSVVGYNALFLYGVTLAPASDGAVLIPGLIPLATFGLARVLFGERVPRRILTGLGVALVGLVLVIGPGVGGGGDRLLGDLLFVAGAGVWAAYSIIGRSATRRFHPAVATLLGTALGALILLPVALGEGGLTRLAEATTRALAGVGYLAIFGTVLGFVFFYEGIRRIGAAQAAAFSVLVPIFGVALALVVLGEQLDPASIVGGVLVLVGLWLVEAARRNAQPRPVGS